MIVLLLLFVAAAACGGGSGFEASTSPDPTTGAGFEDGQTQPTVPVPEPAAPIETSFPMCSDIEYRRAPDAAYRDSPIYVANEQPVEEVMAWAQQQPGYVTIWVDRERNGWITVAFTQDVGLRTEELAAEFPGVGVVAVEVDWTEAELADLQDRVTDVLRSEGWSFGSGRGVARGYVSAEIGVLSPERLAVLEEHFAGERLCVSGIDPSEAIPDGPQPEAGEGWRLLGAERDAGRPYRTAIAWDEDSYAALWGATGIEGEAPDVDFESEVVVWFGAVYGSSCPGLRLDDVIFDLERSVVHGEIVLPSSVGPACTSDALPHAFVVALERSRLPQAPFSIQLSAEGPPAGAPEERTIVDADLRAPGSVAAPGSISQGVYDPEAHIRFVQPGEVIEPGFPIRLMLDTHCGIDWIGLNGVTWHAPDHPAIPAEWEPVLDGEAIVVELLLTEGDPPTLTATANGYTVDYEATSQERPGCD